MASGRKPRRSPIAVRPYRDGLVSDAGAPKRKLAEQVAERIERDIVDRGWPVGEVIGSETELLASYDVSRAVLREAVRLLEHHGVATMRRGPGGGLVVTEPNALAVAEAVALVLEYQKVEPRYVFEARMNLELACVQMAAENIDEEGVAVLRELIGYEEEIERAVMPVHSHDWHIAVAALSGNPAMHLFVTILTRLTRERSRKTRSANSRSSLPEVIDQEYDEVHRAHVKITEAIIAGDSALARHRMLRHLEAVATYLG